ncbi:MAG TPA: hypothetical protein VHM30_03535 [Gemmatimonadaceae bacterium]|nr:hypothetical protein [Gemmatimonadaceae bacterium]
MVGITALWLPILLSAVFVSIALLIIHGLLGWHKGDMIAVPGEPQVMETMRGLNVKPGDYRFPHGNTVAEMTSPEFVAKMNQGPVGIMTIWPNGELNMGKMLGQWLVYALVVAVFAAYLTGRTRGPGAPYLEVFRVSGTVAFCCYAVAHWQNWIWWGKSTRFTVTHTLDAIIYALITGATFGWLWPR